MNIEKRIAGPSDAGMRLDKWLASRFPAVSRESWKRSIAEEQVSVNGQAAPPSKILTAGDLIEIRTRHREEDEGPRPESLPIKVLYEDEWLAVIDKPAGLVVHPAYGHEAGTLVNALLGRFPGELSDLAGTERPGIVHRLDKDTSGTILIARNNDTHRMLADLFRTGSIDRYYEAVVRGLPQTAKGLIDAPLARGDVNRKKMLVREGGREARTEFELLSGSWEHSHLRCRLLTGRTHQIRVHLAYIGHPVVGDSLYGGRRRQGDPVHHLLHASELAFIHPVTREEFVCRSPLPERFEPYIPPEEGAER